MEKQGLMLAPILSDGMILQREVSNCIYGREDIGASVIVSFMGADYYTEVDEKHEFCVELPPVPAGGPYEITVKGSSEITLQDVLVGDVYLLSGQSNMELPIRRVLDVSGEEIARVQEPFIRQYHIPATYNFKEPESYMYAGTWKKAEGEDLLNFSAAGYFFARELKEAYQIPVGLIMTAVGGSTIEAWMSPSSLAGFGNYQELIKDYDNLSYFNEDIRKQQEESEEWMARLEQEESKEWMIRLEQEESEEWIARLEQEESREWMTRLEQEESEEWMARLEQEESEEWMTRLEQKKSMEEVARNYTAWDTCKVPSFVSEFLEEDFQGSLYLCKEIHLEEEPILDTAYIYMGSIIDSDRIWINHREVGRTDYRYPPRKYQIPKGILEKGNNLITVRIAINNTNGGTVKGKPYLLHYDNKEISLEGEWHYRIGKRVENPIPKVLFPPKLPVCFYNTVVVPLSRVSVVGVLWYQGESNTDAPGNYADKFTAMVSDWRELFGWELPFIYVQLTNYKDPLTLSEDTGWAELRDQQRRCLGIYNVAMVTTLDIGESNDLHPQNKKEVGVRLAKAARALIYKENILYSGPIPKSAVSLGREAKITFRHIENSEIMENLRHFEVAGEDGSFQKASAIRRGDTVYLKNDEITDLKYVRYAWCDNPADVNFFNEAGLPASGFCLEL